MWEGPRFLTTQSFVPLPSVCSELADLHYNLHVRNNATSRDIHIKRHLYTLEAVEQTQEAPLDSKYWTELHYVIDDRLRKQHLGLVAPSLKPRQEQTNPCT